MLSDLTKTKSRYLTHISTDKPIYKLEDTIRIRGVLLHAIDQTPLNQNSISSGKIQILGPKGDQLHEGYTQEFENSVFSYSWNIPSEATGGDYTIKVVYPIEGFPSAERKVEVRAFQNPRLNSQIEFVKKGYSSGELATFTLNVKRAEGGIPEGAKVTSTARIDGKEAWTGKTTLDKNGNCLVQFTLPKDIKEGEGTLTCVIEDGGVVETASKTIPILMEETMTIDLYPEGGDLVCGLECGIYVEANNKNGEPGDITGDIIDESGETVVTIITKHEGRGKQYFVPKEGKKYSLKVTKPTGIKKLYPLPESKKEGVSLISTENVYSCDEMISLKLAATKKCTYFVTIFKREAQLTRAKVNVKTELEPVQFTFTLPSDSKADGVLRVLVEDDQKKPLAERLIFRRNAQTLKCQITPDYKHYCPGDKAKVRLFTSDEDGNAVPAYLCLTVTDESVLESVEKRKQAPRLAPMVYLEQEVDHLEDAKIYLGQDQKAELAVDLLLGTQGWRRFAFSDFEKFFENNKIKAERFLGVHKGEPGRIIPISNNSYELEDDEDEVYLERTKIKTKKSLSRSRNESSFAEEEKKGGAIRLESKNTVLSSIIKPQSLKSVDSKQKESVKSMDKKKESIQLAPKMKKEESSIPIQDISFSRSESKSESYPKKLSKINPSYFKKPNKILSKPVSKPIRIYAHKKRNDRQPGDRQDFTETLYWNPILKTSNDGRCFIEFDLSDSVTSFHIMVDVFTDSGIISSFDKLIESKEPFYMEPKLPLEVTSGDIISLPLSLVNSSTEEMTVKLSGQVSNGLSQPKFPKSVQLNSEERKRVVLDLEVDQFNGESSLTFKGDAGAFSDTITRKTKIVPLGFPTSIHHAAFLEGGKDLKFQFQVPEKISKNSLEGDIKIFTSPLSNLNSALGSMLKEPYGCFEQTSSSNYPLLIAHQYLTSHQGVDSNTISRSLDLLEKGYKRLITFECKKHGFEWFGSGDALETLTAYGIMQFMDMKNIIRVDENMLNRTITWLLSRRDGRGEFKLNEGKAYQMSHGYVPKELSLAYILFALTEAGIKDLDKELDYLYSRIGKDTDAYIMALASISFYNSGRQKQGHELAQRLAGLIDKDGSVKGAKTSITRSWGASLVVETTSLSILAWLKDYSNFTPQVQQSLKYIHKCAKDGRYGSTQASILALKAIVGYDKMITGRKDGTATIIVNGSKTQLEIPAKAQDTISISSFIKDIVPGKDNELSIHFSEGCSLSYALSIYYNTILPTSDEECVVDLETKISSDTFTEGAGGEIDVKIKNKSNENQAMTVAIIGLPGGCEPRHEQLKQLVEKEVIAAYEISGRKVIVYFRYLEANSEINFKVDIIARVPGKYQAPPSRAYLYYTDEYKKWVDGSKCTIEAKE